MIKPRKGHVCQNRAAVEGNNGGSYIILEETDRAGIVRLEVGETCIRTVKREISVVGLAAILTWASDKGFDAIIAEYWPHADENWGCDRDPSHKTETRPQPPRGPQC